MDDLKPKQKLRRLAGLSIDEVREDKKQRQAKILQDKIDKQLAEEKRIEEKMKSISITETVDIPEPPKKVEDVQPSIDKAKESLQELVSIFGNITDFKVKKQEVKEEKKVEVKAPSKIVAKTFGLEENKDIGFNADEIKISIKPEPIVEEKKKPVIHEKKVVQEEIKPITPVQPIKPTKKLAKQSVTSQFQEDADTYVNLEKRQELYEALKRGDINSKVYKVEMKKLEKERQTAIDEKKARIADMHQAQLERMEKDKINPVIQAYQKNKTVFQSKIQDTRDYVDGVLKQLDQVSYENDSKEVIDERTEVEKMRGELSKFKEMFGQTIKNLTPIITEQAESQAQGEISGGGGGEIKFSGLDDIDIGSRFHGAMLRYDEHTQKYRHVDDDLNSGIANEDDSGDEIILNATTTSGSDEGHSIQQEDFTRNNVLAEVVTGATVGSSSAIPVITFNNQGLITSMTTAAISGSLTIGADSGSDDVVTVGTDTLNFTGGEGIDTTVSNNTITIAGEDASTSNKGVASFSSDNFAVSSGAVTIKNGGIVEAELADDAVSSDKLKTLSTLLIKNSSGTTLKTVHGAGA